MARPKDETKIDAIFEATLKLVQKSGFNGLKMADVAKAAGMATGTLYIYFKNKDVLINELFLSLKQSKTSRMMAGYDAADSFADTFRKLWFNYLELSLAEPERMLFIEQFAHTSFLTKKTKQQGDQMLEPLIAFLEQGMQKKIIRKMPMDLLLSQLMGPIYETIKAQQSKKLVLTPAQKQGMFEMAWRSVAF
ncbi:MAG: TetR/AcrR family transcriptional regulator [Cyclobacteriaceae bacterium]|nr:TetR/AcrR family transcriptional regulator [Cyclobacteriaceae bacterium]